MTTRTYQFRITHITDAGDVETLHTGTVQAVDVDHAEFLVKRVIYGHRSWPSLYWRYAIVNSKGITVAVGVTP